MDPYRKLLVLGVNHLIETGAIDLAADEDVEGNVQTELAGRHTVVMWHGIGFGELRVSVWWDYDHSKHPQAEMEGNFRERFACASPLANRNHYPKFVGVTASAWLERRKGKYLQGKGRDFLTDIYARRGMLDVLKALSDPVPRGFAVEGRKHI